MGPTSTCRIVVVLNAVLAVGTLPINVYETPLEGPEPEAAAMALALEIAVAGIGWPSSWQMGARLARRAEKSRSSSQEET